MKSVAIAALFLIGLFCGGCALLFLPELLGDILRYGVGGIETALAVIAFGGFGIAYACFVGIRGLLKPGENDGNEGEDR